MTSKMDGDSVGFVIQASLGFKKESDLTEFYSNNAEKYDKSLFDVDYTGPALVAGACLQAYNEAERKDVKILDVAAGTGLCGSELKQRGFCNIDALDPSSGMLELARERNIYNNFFCEFMTQKKLPINEGAYDSITCAGGFMDGHIPCAALYEMIRIIKPGGYINIGLREEYLLIVPEYKDRLEPLMDQLEDEGKWTKIKKDVVPGFALNKAGVIYQFKKL